jgi:PAS domain S-box-containing protein
MDYLNVIPAAVMVVDRNHKIVEANIRCEDVLGYAPDELLGRSVHDLVPEGMRAEHITMSVDYMKCPVEKHFGAGRDLCALRKDGSVIPVEISLVPIDDKILVTLIDISVREKMEEIHRKLDKISCVLKSTMDSINNITGG